MKQTLGELLLDARKAKGMSMRALADQLAVSPAYICDIENDRRIPAESVIENFAEALDLNFLDLMATAGRFGTATERYIKRHPAAIRLLQKCAELNLTDDELIALADYHSRVKD